MIGFPQIFYICLRNRTNGTPPFLKVPEFLECTVYRFLVFDQFLYLFNDLIFSFKVDMFVLIL
jgi:hypothetical protein